MLDLAEDVLRAVRHGMCDVRYVKVAKIRYGFDFVLTSTMYLVPDFQIRRTSPGDRFDV